MSSSRLVAIVDGQTLPTEEAHGLWLRFSAHMDANEGDFDGFAASEGYRYAQVAVKNNAPHLLVSTEPLAPEQDEKPKKRRGKRGGRRKKKSGNRK